MTVNDSNTLNIHIVGRDLEFHPVKESPCRRACPAGIDVKRYVGQIAGGDFAGALATIRKHMPFPSACGRICIHPCENECARGDIDKPIAIMHLKRFVLEYELRSGNGQPLPECAESTGKKIAIIGSGPAGLTAAQDLALSGHSVTVFEKDSTPGGNLTNAIPEFELPNNSVAHDIDRITGLGVKIVCDHPVDPENGIGTLLGEGYDCVLIASGASNRWSGFSGKSWIEGGDTGITGTLEFMRKFSAGPSEDEDNPGRVVVLGWGVQALGCARTAVRLGCSVKWIVPVLKNTLQPDPERVKLAEEEGVEILELTRPLSIIKFGDKITGINVTGLEADEIDHANRMSYGIAPGTERVIECDTIIDAAYFSSETSWPGFSDGPWNAISVDRDTMTTSRPGIFAAGDIVSGAKSVVEAVSAGHRAAAGINRYLSGEIADIGSMSRPIKVSGWELDDPSRTPSEVLRPKARPVDERAKDFDEAVESFSVWEATHEARRCLLCGPCEECSVCLSNCYRKRGTAIDESGNSVLIRMPLGVARGIREETIVGKPDDINLFTAVVDPERCRGCGVCENVCEYHAPRIAPDSKYGLVSSIDILACKGCGTCISMCPSGAIDQGVSSLHQVDRKIRGGKR